jgi:hypothetical protein
MCITHMKAVVRLTLGEMNCHLGRQFKIAVLFSRWLYNQLLIFSGIA